MWLNRASLAYRGRRLLFVAFVLVLAGAACKGKPEISLDVALPASVSEGTTWIEVGAFRDASCAALVPMLGGGVPEGYAARVAFKLRPTAEDPAQLRERPKFGDLPAAEYAFAAVARGDDCGVLALGCTDVDVADTKTISILLKATDAPTGACGQGAACTAGRCIPANDNSDPSVGTNCSLELLGAGPLANPVAGPGTIVSAPAIAASPNGFIAVYREIDPSSPTARLTAIPIDNGGGASKPFRPGLPNRCSTTDEADGVGLIIKDNQALVALAKAPCGDRPALDLLDVEIQCMLDDNAGNQCVRYSSTPSPAGVRLALGPARAAASRSGGSVVVFTEGGVAKIATMDSGSPIFVTPGTFGAANSTEAWVASSENALAFLSVGKGVPPSPGDAGDDAASSSEDAGDESTLSLLMIPAATPLDQISGAENKPRSPVTFPGVWGAIAARGSRVIVLSDGSGPNRSVAYRAYDLGREVPADSSGFSIQGDSASVATAGDVAIQNDRVYFAVLKPGALSVNVYANASTTPTPLRDAYFANEPRIPSVSNVRADGRVSIAATDTRVAVVWTTAKVLGPNDATGGYAVFACSQ